MCVDNYRYVSVLTKRELKKWAEIKFSRNSFILFSHSLAIFPSYHLSSCPLFFRILCSNSTICKIFPIPRSHIRLSPVTSTALHMHRKLWINNNARTKTAWTILHMMTMFFTACQSQIVRIYVSLCELYSGKLTVHLIHFKSVAIFFYPWWSHTLNVSIIFFSFK